MLRAFLSQDKMISEHIQSVKKSKCEERTFTVIATHALQVGYVANINEIMSRTFLKLNLNNPYAIKDQTKLKKEDLEEFKYLLMDLAQSKESGNKMPFLSP